MTATEQGYHQQRQQQQALGLVCTHIAIPKSSRCHQQAVVSPRSAHQAHNGSGSSRPFSAVFKRAHTACGMTYQLQPDALIPGAGDHQQQQQQQQQAGSAPANTVKSLRRLAQQHSKLLLQQQQQQQQQRHALLAQRLLQQQLGAISANMYASWGGPGAVPQANIAYPSRCLNPKLGAFGANSTTAAGAAGVPLQSWGFDPIDTANVFAPVTPEQTADSTLGGVSLASDAGVPCIHSAGAVGQPRFGACASPAAAAAGAVARQLHPAPQSAQCFQQHQQQQQQQRLGLSVSMPMSYHLYADSAAAQCDDSSPRRPAKRQPHMQGASIPSAGGCLDPSAWPAFGSWPGLGQASYLGPDPAQGFTAGFLQGLSQAQLQLLVTPAAVLLLQQQQQHADLGSANRSYSVQRRPSRKRRHAAASPDAAATAAAETAANIAAADCGAGELQPSQTFAPAAAAGSIAQLLHVSDSRQAAAQLARMSRAELFRFAAVAIGHGGNSTEYGLSNGQSSALGICKQDGLPAAAAAAAAGAKCTADCSPASSASTADVCLSSGRIQQELEGFYSKPMTPQEAAEEAQAAAAAIVAAAKAAAAVKVHGRPMYSRACASPAASSQQQEAKGLFPSQQQQQQQQEEGLLSPVATPAAPATVRSLAESLPQHSSRGALPAQPNTLASLAASPASDCGTSGDAVPRAASAEGAADGILLHRGWAIGMNVALGARAGSDGFAGLEGFTPVSAAVLAGSVLPETPFGVAGFEDVPFAWGAAAGDLELLGGW